MFVSMYYLFHGPLYQSLLLACTEDSLTSYRNDVAAAYAPTYFVWVIGSPKRRGGPVALCELCYTHKFPVRAP
jgi:hypothetical protein